MMDHMNPEAFTAEYEEYEALKAELAEQEEREWKALLRDLMED